MTQKLTDPIHQEAPDRLLYPGLVDVLCHRYFPVLSLTYIASVVGIAIKSTGPGSGFLFHLLEDPQVYHTALWVGLWVSVPALSWIGISNALHMRSAADLWYKVMAALMVATVFLSLFLFPIGEVGYEVRMFLLASIPIFIVQYDFFVKEGLPPAAAWPLTVAGITLLVYGLIL